MQSKCFVVFVLLFHGACFTFAQDDSSPTENPAATDPQDPAEVPAGHSYHGEFLNEGPRQSAYLMGGTGHVHFPITTEHDQVQNFFEQGLGQFYGFWTLEAERSFRQAAALEPNCAMAYWGAALVTRGNEKRAKGFIAEAVKHQEHVTEREKMYIKALDQYLKTDNKKNRQRAEQYTQALENISLKFPEDVEAKALLALQLYQNRSAGIKTLSHLAVDALMQQVFEVEPMHSAHHFRIHLWDYKKPELAVSSAALCGQTSPSIAHMWHMPGHIFSRLKRYDDACWQQEASARVDHAHMMRDRVLPDEIHNFAHNNEWFIRNMNYVGRVRDAIALAKNMIELPRHPKYNTLKRNGSTKYGRMRLFETLTRYELWEELVELSHLPYLEPTDDALEQTKRLHHLGRAYFRLGDLENGEIQLADLRQRLTKQQEEREAATATAETKALEEKVDQAAIDKAIAEAETKAREENKNDDEIEQAKTAAAEKARNAPIEKAKEKAREPFKDKIKNLENAVNELDGLIAVGNEDFKTALTLLEKSKTADPIYLAWVKHMSGETDTALADAKKHVDRKKNEVHPQACYADLLWQVGKHDEAKQAFERLREISSSVDLASPVFQRLAPIAADLGLPEEWPNPVVPRDDVGNRPNLDNLGPFRWQASVAADWQLNDAQGNTYTLKHYAGKPVVVIFYLGYGCLHCAEQLQAFAPLTEEFRAAGIELVAISTDNQDDLQRSIDSYDKGALPIRLLSNAGLEVFKSYRAFDDFEQQPLHGTFLIDGEGNTLWQDISYEPFMEPQFLLKESQRLVKQRSITAP